MAKALKVVGTIVGAAAVVASGGAALGIVGPIVAGKVAAIASVVADPLTVGAKLTHRPRRHPKTRVHLFGIPPTFHVRRRASQAVGYGATFGEV